MTTREVTLKIVADIAETQRKLAELPGNTEKQAAAMARSLARHNLSMQRSAERAAQKVADHNRKLELEQVRAQKRVAAAAAKAAEQASEGWRDGFQIAIADTIVDQLTSLGRAFVETTDEVMQQRLELARLAREGDQSVATIQGIQLAARQAAIDVSSLDGAFEDLPERMLDAANGSGELHEAMQMLGDVSLRKANGEFKTATEFLPELIESLQGIEDKGRRSALATLALGDGGRAMMAALGDRRLEHFVGLVDKFGVDAGPQAIETARKWREETELLNLLLDNQRQGFADLTATVLPSFNRLLIRSSVFLSTLFREAANDVETFASEIYGLLTSDIWEFPDRFESFAAAGFELATAGDDVKAAWQEADRVLENIQDTLASGDSNEGPGDGPERRQRRAIALLSDQGAARQRLADLTASIIEEQLEGEARIEAALARRLETIGELAAQSGDQLTAQLAMTEAVASAERDLADLRQRLADEEMRRQMEAMDLRVKNVQDLESIESGRAANQLSAFDSMSGASSEYARLAIQLANTVATAAERGSEREGAAQQRARVAAFRANQIAATSNVAFNTAQAIVRQYAEAPVPVAAGLSAFVAGIGAVQAGLILAQQPPTAHQGRYAPAADELDVRVQRREVVVPTSTVDANGGPSGVRDRLESSSQPMNFVLEIDGESRDLIARAVSSRTSSSGRHPSLMGIRRR